MSEAKKPSRLIEFLIIFAIAYIVSQGIIRFLGSGKTSPLEGIGSVALVPADTTVRGGHHPVVVVKNHQKEPLVLANRCPMPPVEVFAIRNPGTAQEERNLLHSEETAQPCVPLIEVAGGGEAKIDFGPWKYSLFGEFGTYEVRLPAKVKGAEGKEWDITARFVIHEPNGIVRLFRALVTKPLLNFLILIASVVPGHNVGIAIAVLTLIVKILLFFPTQHAMEGQRKMQMLQPKVSELKEKYKGDAARLQQETMKLWKEHKVNPFQSCLPMVIQFPVLIGLFFVVQDGIHVELAQHLLYPSYSDLPWKFGLHFLGMDLTKPNWTVFPVLLVVLQFIQMKLSFQKAKGKQQSAAKGDMQEAQQKVMLYMLPLMVGGFAIQFPAGVAFYWAVSTLFAIGQQMVVNREKLKP